MGLSHWVSDQARTDYRRAYVRSLELWPIAHESKLVSTPFGQTHVIVSGADSGDPVLLVHAAAMSATQWHPQAADLGESYRLYAVDIMGDIGRSIQQAAVRTRAEAAAWVTGLLDGLEIDRAIFIGSSFGGFHAANAAVHNPERVRAMVLLAPAATVKPFKPLAKLTIRTGNWLPLRPTVKPALRAMMGGALPDERIVRQMEVGVVGFRYDHRGVFPSELPDGELAGLGCPTLLLLGDKEMIYAADAAAERARSLIKGVEAEIVPGVGHLLGMQEPVAINRRILQFLGSIR